ncbi:MAG: prepilin-type N-terminal cleavage/methylation domain-containing protein [Planctomycetaceae bacterium]|jgi:prepilin-type N-terminal cleavage/methylation domain-containing protein|nr:prepilin-type N-terminal cleavage/methylation domain-containing protein [Planctomycetaceae bacterium]
MKRFAFTLIELIVVIVIIAILGVFVGIWFLAETPFYILFGWIWGLWRLVAGLANEPAAIGFGILAFLLLPFVFHLFAAPISKRLNKLWTFKKSFVVSSLIVLIAGAGIATVGGIHEIVWAFGGKEPLIDGSRGGFETCDISHVVI